MEFEQLERLSKEIETILKEKRSFVLEKFNSLVSYEYKAAREIVTEVDRALELFLKEKLNSLFPASFLGEETGETGDEDSPYSWVVDPLDGTTNFVHKIPFFNTSIALVEKNTNKVLLGIVYYYHLDLFFKAIHEGGAWVNGKSLKLKPYDLPLKSVFLSFCHTNTREAIEYVSKIYGKVKLNSLDFRRLGSANLEICYVALGKIGAFFGYKLKPWDFLASCLIAQEARAEIETMNKKHWTDPEADSVIVYNPSLGKDLIPLFFSED